MCLPRVVTAAPRAAMCSLTLECAEVQLMRSLTMVRTVD